MLIRTALLMLLCASVFHAVAARAQAYSTVVSANSGKCMDVEAGGWNTGDRVIQYACHGLDNQQWTLTPYNGSYQVIGKRLGQCLTVSGDSSQAGAQMVQYPCGGYVNQLWDLRANGSAWQLVAKQTGMCLAAQNDSTADVTPLVQQPCQGIASGLWTFSNPAVLPQQGTPTTIVPSHSGKCLTISGASTAAGAQAVQTTCDGSAAQQWTVLPSGSGYAVVSRLSGLCLGIAGADMTPAAYAVQLTCDGSANTLWTLQASGATFMLIAKHSGMCLDIYGSMQDDGANAIQWTCTGTANQQWSLTVSSAPAASAITTVIPRHSGKCLAISGNSTAAGAQAVQITCDGSAQQNWKVTAAGAYYTIASVNSNLCLGIANASTALEAPAVQLACDGSPNTLWSAQTSNGRTALVAKHSGLCLDIYGSMLDDGARAIQWTCSGTDNQTWALSLPTGSGGGGTPSSAWSPVITLPIVPVAAALLPNGKVLAWSSFAPDNFGNDGQYGNTYSVLFDPVTQISQERNVTETGHDMFCPGTTLLTDGRLLVNGGSSSQKTSIYNYADNTWTTGPLMNIPRGYEGNAILADGSVLTLGGSWSGGQGGKNGEIWTAGKGWKKLTGIPIDPFVGTDPAGAFRSDNHLWLFSYTNGRVFHAGPSAAMHWITTAGTGSVSSAGNRGDDAYSMNGNAVMYDIGKILKTGGAPAYEEAYATANSYVIDLNSGTTRKLAPMNYARTLHNSTVLPNGQVVITGGQTYAHLFSDDRAVLMAELWDPATDVFTPLSAMAVARTYHSFSLLLPDGRVLVGGGGLCGSCTANHPDVQIFTPPYLLNADGTPAARPAVTAAPTSAAYGTAIGVTTDSAVSGFVLMRMGAATHSINNDQRRVPLQSSTADNRNYTLQIPADRGIAPPGFYMLFALNAGGTPSMAKTIQLK